MTTLAHVLHQERLHINIWEEDGMFIAECIDIPGCMSQGRTRNEALTNINHAISLCLEVIMEDAGHQQQIAASDKEVIEIPLVHFLASNR